MILLLCIAVLYVSHAAEVRVKMEAGYAKGRYGPEAFSLEVAEFISSIDGGGGEGLMWKLLDALPDGDISYERVYSIAVDLIAEEFISLMDWSLSLHYFSPNVFAWSDISEELQSYCNGAAVLLDPSSQQYFCEISQFNPISGESFEILPGDRIYPPCALNKHTIVLYGSPGQTHFSSLFQSIRSQCEKADWRFVFRPFIPHSEKNTSLYLQGWAAELALKNMEYSVLNDKDVVSRILSEEEFVKESDLHEDDATSVEGDQFGTKQEEWDFSQIGEQVFTRIMESDLIDRIGVLQELSQNFPSHAAALQLITAPISFKKDLAEIRSKLRSGQNMLWLNGIEIDTDFIDLFHLYELVAQETQFYAALRDLKIPEEVQHSFSRLQHPQLSSFRIDLSYDSSLEPIAWANDISKDSKYKQWPNRLEALLSPGWPQQIRYVSQNLYHMAMVVSPANLDGLALLDIANRFIEHNAPFRLGLVCFEGNGKWEKLLCGMFYEIEAKLGVRKAFGFFKVLKSILQKRSGDVSKEDVLLAFKRSIAMNPNSFDSVEEIVNAMVEGTWKYSDHALKRFRDTRGYTEGRGWESYQLPLVFFNGIRLFDGGFIDEENFRRSFMEKLIEEQQMYQQHVYYGTLNDSTDLMLFPYKQPNAFRRVNVNIMKSLDEQVLLPLSRSFLETHEFSSSGNGFTIFTLLFGGKWNTEVFAGIVDVVKVSKYGVRMAVFRDTVECSENAMELQNVLQLKSCPAQNPFQNTPESFVIVNGRVINTTANFDANDITTLLDFEWKTFTHLISETFQLDANTFCVLQSILSIRNQHSADRADIDGLFSEISSKIERIGSNSISIFAVVDPLSTKGPMISGFLRSIEAFTDFNLRIILNPSSHLKQIPLKQFYRFNFNPSMKFYPNGNLVETTALIFENLPQAQILTLTTFSPETWMTSSSQAEIDLDNILLSNSKERVQNVLYELEHIIIAGQCFDGVTKSPPAGLQLELYSAGSLDKLQDTVVMENLGYFQLKANPGFFDVKIEKSHGKVYEMVNSKSIQVGISRKSFVQLKVIRKSGMQTADILKLTKKSSILQRIPGMSMLFPEEAKSTIHVFSLASGHLYERFLRIMMLSVTQNTKSPVKFWFIGQFLSPQFKHSIYDYAKQLGADVSVELIDYKWPFWLRRQSEKQRTIWGFKILFLDVLFPLDVSRIVFVDADQVVRSDLSELFKLDLGDAPYAYTPFCDSNKETEGFRFWKHGYWKDHLQGKPYHISALYVVDLDKFRAMRAGDQLRIIYDQLSRDPASLSNLDQDLPNFAQSMVPIYSLEQEWLWCETWCSMDTLGKAKTIDLCNNPLTKEPKLDRAKRIVKEWDELDKEVYRLMGETV